VQCRVQNISGEQALQVCDPADLNARLLISSKPPALSEVQRLAKCLASIMEVAGMLGQERLRDALEELLSFLHAWFDFDQHCCLGILRPGHAQLDELKEQFMALPTLLKQVRHQKTYELGCHAYPTGLPLQEEQNKAWMQSQK
jgi:hypothetical protein